MTATGAKLRFSARSAHPYNSRRGHLSIPPASVPLNLHRKAMQHNLFRRFSLLLLTLAVLSSCVTGPNEQGFRTISQKSARRLMDKRTVTVVDVREAAEYAAGHLPGAILLPLGTITAETAAAAIPSKDATVLVYCRSGKRSQAGSAALAALGYTDICNIGGIMTWPYEIVIEP